jgi:hypothetical protein
MISLYSVIPAQAGIQSTIEMLDVETSLGADLRRHDEALSEHLLKP